MLIELNNLSKSFYKNTLSTDKSKKQVLKELNLKIYEGDFFALEGKNGSGKTTLLKILRNIIYPDSGTLVMGNDLNYSEISYVSQNIRSFFLNLSLENNLNFFSGHQEKILCNEYKNYLLNGFNLHQNIETKVSNLSSGQVKKLSIIRGLLLKPKLLLLDEPFTFLDRESKDFLLAELSESFSKKNILGVIWATHDKNEINQIFTRHILIEQMKLVEKT